MRVECLVVMIVGCSSSDPSGPADTGVVADTTTTSDISRPADAQTFVDAGCEPPMDLFWRNPGCDATPECLMPQDTACVTIVCGCDGLVHFYGCTGAEAPFRSRIESPSPMEGDPCGPMDAGGD
jgi:hypothetical protein